MHGNAEKLTILLLLMGFRRACHRLQGAVCRAAVLTSQWQHSSGVATFWPLVQVNKRELMMGYRLVGFSSSCTPPSRRLIQNRARARPPEREVKQNYLKKLGIVQPIGAVNENWWAVVCCGCVLRGSVSYQAIISCDYGSACIYDTYYDGIPQGRISTPNWFFPRYVLHASAHRTVTAVDCSTRKSWTRLTTFNLSVQRAQAYGGGAREAEPTGKGCSCVYLCLIFGFFLPLHPFQKLNRIKRIMVTK
jgi:hypothetical protein